MSLVAAATFEGAVVLACEGLGRATRGPGACTSTVDALPDDVDVATCCSFRANRPTDVRRPPLGVGRRVPVDELRPTDVPFLMAAARYP